MTLKKFFFKLSNCACLMKDGISIYYSMSLTLSWVPALVINIICTCVKHNCIIFCFYTILIAEPMFTEFTADMQHSGYVCEHEMLKNAECFWVLGDYKSTDITETVKGIGPVHAPASQTSTAGQGVRSSSVDRSVKPFGQHGKRLVAMVHISAQSS